MGVVGDRFGLQGSILLAAVCVLIFCAVTFYGAWICKDKTEA
jgi:hypothetical protein